MLAGGSRARGSGTEPNGIGTRSRSMGYAMVGVADDWSAVHYNPAGIAQTEGRRFGLEYEFFTGGGYSSESLRNLAAGGDPSRGDFFDPIGDEPVSFSAKKIVAPIHAIALGYIARRDRIAFGTGLYGSGSGTGWEDSMQTGGGDTLKGEISFTNGSANVPLVLGYRASPVLDLGVRMALHYGLLDVDCNKCRTGAVPYTMKSNQDTDGIGFSFNLGMLARPSARTSVGLVLKLPYSFERKGDSTVVNSLIPLTVSTSTTVRTYYPTRIAAGLAFRPDEKSLLALSATWMGWRAYRQKTSYGSPIPGIFDDSDGNPARWKNVVLYAVGYERKAGLRWTLRCGALYDEAPEPKRYRTLVGGLVVDTWKLSIGAGVDVGGNTLNMGYTYAFGPDAGGYVPGADYGVTTHELYVGYEWKF